MAPEQQRFAALDGLRGWAALSVVIYHCYWQTFGAILPELHHFLGAILGNGILAVAVFLTISGYVLTRKRWRNPANPPLHIAFIRRYIRLTIPIIAATLLVFVLMSFGLTPTRAAYRITEQREWYNTFVRFEPNILNALGFAFVGTYTWPFKHNYNPFLWTMLAELWGSFLLFALSQSGRFTRDPYSPLLLIGTILLMVFPLAACFIAGALIALAEQDKLLRATPSRPISLLASIGLIALMATSAFIQVQGVSVRSLALAGTGIFLAARYSVPAQRFLMLGVSQFLGRISFPIYLVQFAVIVSLSANAIIWADANGRLNATNATLIAAVSVLVCLVLATLFLPIELATLSLLRRFDRWRPAPRAAAASLDRA